MEQNAIFMGPQKAGRMKYLLLTLIPPVLYAKGVELLCQKLPQLAPLGPWLGMIGLSVIALSLGYVLIFKKNHQFEVSEKNIHIKEMFGQAWDLPARRIHHYRRNLLGELVLFDEDNKRLLTAESNMTGFDEFKDWLERHGIERR